MKKALLAKQWVNVCSQRSQPGQTLMLYGMHKLRNEIAHNTEARVSYDDARRALAGFKRGLKDLGAI